MPATAGGFGGVGVGVGVGVRVHTPQPNETTPTSHGRIDSQINTNTNSNTNGSVALSCMSPDGLAVHSLINGGTIVTQFLPLHDTTDHNHESESSDAYEYNNDNNNNSSSTGGTGTVKRVTTTLPTHIVKALRVDIPLEIVCVENDTPQATHCRNNDGSGSGNGNGSGDENSRKRHLPLLCIYTANSVHILNIYYKYNNNNSGSTTTGSSTSTSCVNVNGIIQEIHEPMEEYLTSQNNIRIVRIRSAPHSFLLNGRTYQTLCNKGAFIMLTMDGSVVLFHGYHVNDNGILRMMMDVECTSGGGDGGGGGITIPARINPEQTDMTPIVDMCFLPSTNSPTMNMTSSSSSTSSNNHAIWNAMTLTLTTENGSLYALSPIIFHHTIVPKAQVQMAHESLQNFILKNDHSAQSNKHVECRRAKAALQFLKDAFGTSTNNNSLTSSSTGTGTGSRGRGKRAGGDMYIKANILNHYSRKSATTWPVALQTLYTSQGLEGEFTGNDAVQCMDVIVGGSSSISSSGLGASSSLAGGTATIVLARKNAVEYMLIPSGDNLLPRFGFELSVRGDADWLDGLLDGSSLVTERILLEGGDNDDDEENDNEREGNEGGVYPNEVGEYDRDGDFSRRIVLIIDPVDRSMVHHISKEGVVTITSNVVSVMDRKLQEIATGKKSNYPGNECSIKTNAWSSISISGSRNSGGKNLNGIVISGDVQLGHVLVAVLDDGTTESVNMTAALYLNEASNQLAAEISAVTTTHSQPAGFPDAIKESDEALKTMESISPLHEQIQPLFAQISKGLSNMSKIVGGTTDPRKITAGGLATFLSTKQSTEQDVIIPIKELNALVSARVQYLDSMRQHQMSQLKQLQNMVSTLQNRVRDTNAKKTAVESNSKMLSDRSAAVLATARELTPNITEAELQYFKDIQRYEVNCGKWEEALEDIRSEYNNIRSQAEVGGTKIPLSAQQKDLCDTLLEGQGELLRQVGSKIKTMEGAMGSIMVANGLEDGRKPLTAITDVNQ